MSQCSLSFIRKAYCLFEACRTWTGTHTQIVMTSYIFIVDYPQTLGTLMKISLAKFTFKITDDNGISNYKG